MTDISVLRGTIWGMIVLVALAGKRPATAAAGRSGTSKRPTAELEAKSAGPELAMLPDDAPPIAMCVDLDQARGKSLRLGYLDRDVGREPHRQRPSRRALRELAALDSSRLPGWGQGRAEVVGVAVGDINRDGTYELYVEYRVSRANSAQQAFNIAALSLPDQRLLWASTTDYHGALPREQTCSGLVQVLDVDCDQISDVVIFRTCHDTMCPRNNSPDAECHGNTTARDIAHLWDPAGRFYRTRSPIKTRDASNDCGAHDTPVILCPPPKRPVRR